MGKSTLYVFNPENDLALACGEPNFTPPPMARKIRKDLHLLPAWLHKEGCVYSEMSKSDIDFVADMQAKFSVFGNLHLFNPRMKSNVIDSVEPWGWSPAILSELERILPDYKFLPDKKQIEELRQSSNRRNSIFLYEKLKSVFKDLGMPETPRYCTAESEVLSAINAMGDCMVKAPWSGSGRGVFHVGKSNYKDYAGWIKSTIRKQGGIVCEKFLDKLQDFAFEYGRDEDGNAAYKGISVFKSNNRFSYEESVVASTAELENAIFQKINDIDWSNLKSFFPPYIKPFGNNTGVDMMLYREKDGSIGLMPCVEVNMRTTMGHVACSIGNDFIAPGKFGRMKILYHKDNRELMRFVETLQPPVIKDDRLESGTLMLTPISSDTNYTATVTIV